MGVNLLADVALRGRPVAWMAPTYKLLMEAWRDALRVLRPVLASSNASDHRIELVTGGVAEFWTLQDPDAGRSRKYARVIVDEAGLVATLGETWQAAIRPTLADYSGDGWMLGTPKGRNFFWECWNRGADPLQPDWASWQQSTNANPHIKPEEIAAMRAELTERRAAQEIDAQFLEDGGGVFRNVQAVSTGKEQRDPTDGHTYVAGGDWGRSGDPTAISVWDATERREVCLERWDGVDFALQEQRLIALIERYRISAFLAEKNSFGWPIIERLQRIGLPVQMFVTTNATKAAAVDALALSLERRDLILLNDPIATAELLAYEGTELPSGMVRYNAPEGQHDDTVIARMLANLAATDTGPLLLW